MRGSTEGGMYPSLAHVLREYAAETAAAGKFSDMITKPSDRQPDMRAKEVAEFLGLHPDTVRRMARQGMFPGAYKLGWATSAQIRIPRADVDRYRRLRPRASEVRGTPDVVGEVSP